MALYGTVTAVPEGKQVNTPPAVPVLVPSKLVILEISHIYI